jgi:transcriptional regulator with XRE-family HTH domain
MGLLSPSPRPGEKLRSLRASVGLTIREVERRSQKLAETKGNPDYLVSHSWLRSIEQGEFTPSIYKFYSLSVIYHRGCEELQSYFGVRFSDLGKDQGMFDWPATHVVGASVDTEEGRIPFPVRLRPDFHPENTDLLTRLVQVWGDVPVALIRQLDLRKSMYGYIGLKDYTLLPVILPGSFVQIDPTQTKVKTGASRRELDRPIYFIELRDSYACGWCELKDGQLSVVPHINSPQGIRRFSYPQEAEIIGRVTGVAMRIVNGGLSPLSGLPEAARSTPQRRSDNEPKAGSPP